MKEYNHKKIEKKWQTEWEKKKVYQASDKSSKQKFYGLMEFPYPSGDGLHVGHVRGYTAMDILSRKKRMDGKNVLFPIGWDAFGLPTENYAIKTGKQPSIITKKNTDNFKKQFKSIGMSFDWSREINTTDPNYYKWTQWLFLQFFKKGLAYKTKSEINWCPKDKIGLANEEVIDGKCERCGTQTEKREKEQWMLGITKYADRLDRDLDLVDYPERVKLSQRNWIGRSEGSEIEFKINLPLTPFQGRGRISKIVILHGRNGKPENYFYLWLKKELEKIGHKVYLPSLPNTDEPNDEEQADFVIKNVPIDNETIFITHSFGGVVAMRLLERGKKIGGLIQFSTPISGKFLDGKKRESVTMAVSKGFDFKKIKNQADYFKVIFDSDDTIVPKEDGEILAKNLGTNLQYIKAKEMLFCAEEEPEMLKNILENITCFQSLSVKGEFGYQTTDPKTWKILQDRVLEMRSNQTPAEEKLWQSIRKNLTGYHFRRQHIIGKFIVDFVCLSKNLVIEIDGDIHDYQKKEDMERTSLLEQTGFKVVRFKNKEVLEDIDGVLEKIEAELKALPFGEGLGGVIKVFTTRADTLFGVTYVVLAPEHELVERLKSKAENREEIEKYLKQVKSKSDLERTENKEKTGVELKGVKVINPANGGEIPVWVADYVLPHYGTGAVMAVPAHDERDFEFTQKYRISDIKKVISIPKNTEYKNIMRGSGIGNWVGHPESFQVTEKIEKRILGFLYKNLGQECHDCDGYLINSGNYDGMSSEEARKKITEAVGGKIVTKFKLRDWVFSRQRYWGEPIPIINCPKCGSVPVPEKNLPVKLPEVKSYKPTDTGESPLAGISKWVNVKCPKCGGPAKRETDTMPNWAGSSWYYLRYCDPKNKKKFADFKKLKYWLGNDPRHGGVNWYNGGMEHTTLHLLYSRFWHKFFYDLKLVPTVEPYMKRTSHGMILGEGGVKMSKSLGNVVNPDDIVKVYGADTLRVYEMFMGPFEDSAVWSTESIIGSRRFIEKVWRIGEKVAIQKKNSPAFALGDKRTGNRHGSLNFSSEPLLETQGNFLALEKLLHKTIKKVGEDIEAMRFNTAISAMMILVGEMEKVDFVDKKDFKMFLQILAPFAPHMTEHLWCLLNSTDRKQINTDKKNQSKSKSYQGSSVGSIHLSQWPKYDEKLIVDNELKIMIQVNGKVRGEMIVRASETEEKIKEQAFEHHLVKKFTHGQAVKKIIYVKNRLVSIVV